LKPEGIEVWLERLLARVGSNQPELLEMFDTYAGEARFGRSYIEPNLQQLKENAHILEVGAGALILSTQLVREGFEVTALEPTGEGFSHFDRLRELVLEEATCCGCAPELLEIPAEGLAVKDKFDFAFSINVMEHVQEVETVIDRVCDSLNAQGEYRFTCPNYLFPYEPHFNIPTVGSKNLTARLFRQRIFENRAMNDPVGVWNSLNWISVPMLKAIARSLNLNRMHFDKRMLSTLLSRAVNDPLFSSRRSPLLVALLSVLVRLRLHKVSLLFPAAMHPVIDCTLAK